MSDAQMVQSSQGERDVDIRCRKVSLVTVRKRQPCFGLSQAGKHSIEPGDTARFEKAIVDGEWGSYYVCITCMNKWLIEECHMEPNK